MHRWRGLAVVLVRRVGEGSKVMLGGDLDAPRNIIHESVDNLDKHRVKASFNLSSTQHKTPGCRSHVKLERAPCEGIGLSIH